MKRSHRASAVEGGVGTGGIELDRRESLRDVLGGALGGQVRVLVDIGLVPGARVDIGVGAQALVHPATEELVHRLPGFLADDVPAGHLQRRQHRHERQIRVLGVAGGVDTAPDRLDIMRVLLEEVALEDVLQHAANHFRVERQAIGLADPVHVVVGGELDEDEITSTDTGLRVADDEGAQLGQFHGCVSPTE